MSTVPTMNTFSGEDGLDVDLEDYLKWRATNSHIGVRNVNHDYPQIFIPSSMSVKDDESSQTCPSIHRVTRSSNVQAKTSFKFLDLPPELRNGIYESAFSVDCTAMETNTSTLKQWLSHSIFRTSRQVRCEALYVFFSCHTWKISYLPQLIPFLNFIGPYCRANLRTLWIEDVFYQGIWSPGFVSDIVKTLNELEGLRKLYIDFTLESLACVPGSLTSPQVVLQTPEFKPLLSLRGLAEVKLSFAPEARFGTGCSWADRQRAFWASWVDNAYGYYFGRHYLNGKSQKEVAMSFLQGLEEELQKTASLPRQAVRETDCVGSIQWKLCDSFAQLFPGRSGYLVSEQEDDAASDEAHTTEYEESEYEWYAESEDDEEFDEEV